MSFETFFLGREQIKNPLIGTMISTGKELADAGGNGGGGTISVRYGNRIVITARNADIRSLDESDFVEVADYDAVRKIVLAIGPNEPPAGTALHWLVYRREGINAIVHIGDLSEKIIAGEGGNFNIAMEALKSLKSTGCIAMKNIGYIAVGKSLHEAVEEVKQYL